MLEAKAFFAYFCICLLIALFFVSCDGEYLVCYAQKKYSEVVSEGKAYADSVKAIESSDRRERGIVIPTRSTRHK